MFNNLSYAEQDLRNRSFKGRKLAGHDFSHSDLRGCDFSDADLTGANFFGVKTGKTWQQTPISILLNILVGLLLLIFLAVVSFMSQSPIAVKDVGTDGKEKHHVRELEIAYLFIIGFMVALAMTIYAFSQAFQLMGIILGGFALWMLLLSIPRFVIGLEIIKSPSGTLFKGANLTDANFSSAVLANCDFSEAVLMKVNWHGARFHRCKFPTDYEVKMQEQV
ncbi:pentapeptide repeat-containing protein [Tumidithrix elongata RA019]|uniref:Pentapeptide repeat-containing protein n=1 Tax=Tumidithrix elongata BACA0141 TaxID=2716417 RepID=A0AAW9PXP3_9CYAN|nr:pentapeptide repeat-containing protein [Tumidithrix elongata RA019]